MATSTPPFVQHSAHRSSARGSAAAWVAALPGVGSFVLALAGLVVWEGVSDRPETDQPASVIIAFFRDHDAVVLGGLLLALASVAFAGFAVLLRERMRAAGVAGPLGTLVLVSGVAAAGLLLLMPAVNVTGSLFADELGNGGARTFYLLGDAFLYPASVVAAVMLAATAIASFRAQVLPRWLGALTVLLAVWLVVPPFGDGGTPENPALWTGLAALPLVPLWAAAVSLSWAMHDTTRSSSVPTP